MSVNYMRGRILIGAIIMACSVDGCGSSAKLISGLSIEELKPLPGILPSAKLVKGTSAASQGIGWRSRRVNEPRAISRSKPVETKRAGFSRRGRLR